MAHDVIKPLGATQASKNDAGGGVLRSEPVLGVVKNNIDPIRAGRIQVYIQDINGFDPNDSKNWITVRYLSPFYGRTYGSGPNTGYGTYTQNPISYGEWHSPPDIGTQVICIFVNGDINYGYYIGCIPEPEALHMVPAIGATPSKVVLNAGEAESLAGATQLPVTNLNANNSTLAESSDFLNAPKSVHSYMASTLSQQGLIRDNVRGPITSSAQRETPSRVGWGVSTPGRPIYEGGLTDRTIVRELSKKGSDTTKIISRRAGHSFVMDDGSIAGKDQLIRLRSALGHQILMSDDGQCLFIIHANGQSWIELGKEGTIDMYATNSVNIRTQGDLNLHADNNVNINADKNLNIAAKENININSGKEMSTRVGADYKLETLQNYTVKAKSKLSLDGTGEASIASSGDTYIGKSSGGKVNLNTGATSLPPPEVKPIPTIAHTDTLFDKVKGFAPAPGKLISIVSRAPAHFPWPNAGQGVDVKTKLNASESLPDAPSEEVDAANNASPDTPENPPEVATNATVPDSGAASESLDANTTASLVGATAKQASAIAPEAVATGTQILNGEVKIGSLAQTASQMVTGGALKPGSQTLINGLIKTGASAQGAMTNNLFTGNNGINDLTSFVNNTGAQVKSMVNNLSASQAGLTKTGVITGKESPTAIAGLVMSGVQNGVKATADFVKNAAGTVSGLLGGGSNGVSQSISLGNFASKLSNSVTGGLGSIAGAITGNISNLVAQAKGIAAGAFASITNAYKTFKANVPQDLSAIAKNTETPNSENVDPYAGLTQEQIAKLGDADATDPFIRSRLGLPPLGGTSGTGSSASTQFASVDVNNIAQQTKTSFSNLTSAQGGLQGLAGGQNAIASVVDKAAPTLNAALVGINNAASSLGIGSVTNIPGTTEISSQLKSLIPQVTALGSQFGSSSIPGTAVLGADIKSLSSSAMNGNIQIPGELTGFASTAKNLYDSTKRLGESNANPLSSLALTGLPQDEAAKLNAALNSLSTGGPIQIKLPTVAVNTINRAEIGGQVNTILGNSKIPAPDYAPNTQTAASRETRVNDFIADQQRLQDELNNQFKVALAAKQKYESLQESLPAGSSAIAQAKAVYDAENKKYYTLYKQADQIGLAV